MQQSGKALCPNDIQQCQATHLSDEAGSSAVERRLRRCYTSYGGVWGWECKNLKTRDPVKTPLNYRLNSWIFTLSKNSTICRISRNHVDPTKFMQYQCQLNLIHVVSIYDVFGSKDILDQKAVTCWFCVAWLNPVQCPCTPVWLNKRRGWNVTQPEKTLFGFSTPMPIVGLAGSQRLVIIDWW